MTETPLCSVLFPTRGRTGKAMRSICQMIRLWKGDLLDLEIIVRVNPDEWRTDVEKMEEFFDQEVNDGLKFMLLVDQLSGYRHLHHYYNQLASLTTGKWIFMMSDDGFIQTDGWDEILAKVPVNPEVEPALLQPECNGEPNCFPIISRAWYRELGHVAHHVSLDGYLQRIGEIIGCMYPVDIYIHHEKHELTGCPVDDTRRERDEFLKEFNQNPGENYVDAPRFMEMIRSDADKIRNYMRTIA